MPVKRGPESHLWLGDAATDDGKRNRTQRRYALGGPCERCGEDGVLRHHKDADPGNNEPENIEILCKGCHQRHHMGKPPRPCGHCGQLTKKFKRGRYNVCYQYLRVNGRDRPRRLIEKGRAVLPGTFAGVEQAHGQDVAVH